MSNEKVVNLLNQVKQIVKTHKEHANKQGENFNIFSILSMERREVKTHSNFIYELLNPHGSHGQGKVFLESFAKIVLNSGVSNTAIDPQQEDATEDNRRIDFTLETDDNVIGIEIKIDAGDQFYQLWDYQEEIKQRAETQNKGTKLFYLTLDSKEASQESITSRDEKQKLEVCKYENKQKDTNNNYMCISFRHEILDWVNDCIKQSAEKSVLREALIQYKILIEKITGQNQDMDTETAKLIGGNKENFQTAQTIYNAFQLTKASLQANFWNELLDELGENYYFGNKNNKERTTDKDKILQACENFVNLKRNQQLGVAYDLNNNQRIMLVQWGYIHYIFQKNKDKCDDWIENTIESKNSGWFESEKLKDEYDFYLEPNSKFIEILFNKDLRLNKVKEIAEEFKALVKKRG